MYGWESDLEMVKDVKIISPAHGQGRNIIEIDGKKYTGVKADVDRKGRATITFREFDEKKFEEDLEEMAKKITPKLNPKEIVKQALRDLPLDDFEKVQVEFEKDKPQVQSRNGCYYLKIGKGKSGVSLLLRD